MSTKLPIVPFGILLVYSLFVVVVVAAAAAAAEASSSTEEQECDATSSADGSNSFKPPQVILNGQRLEINDQNFVKKFGSYNKVLHRNSNDEDGGHNNDNTDNDNNRDNDDKEYDYYILNSDKHVLYITKFLQNEMIDGPNGLLRLCLDQNRFVRSPVRKNIGDIDDDDGGDDTTMTKHDDHRTSESCTGIPVAMYRKNPKVQAMIYPNGMTNTNNVQDDAELPEHLKAIKHEMELHWDVATKATQFIHSDTVDPSIIEPLQIVRYTHPNAQYKLHHDHGGFYRSNTINKESSSTETQAIPVVDERPWTMLVFLNTPLEGGHTSFPKLGLEVMPRKGDAIVWSNVVVARRKEGDDEAFAMTEVVDPDMVHAGLPPTKGEKYALNIWFGPPPRRRGQHDDGDARGAAEKLQQQGRWQ